MEKSRVEESPFSKSGHVGVVVEDMDKAIEFLSSLGIGPFEPLRAAPLIEKKFRGKVTDWKLKIMTANIGQVELELFQPVEGESPQKEFLDRTGGGINHLGFVVDDLDKEVARLTKQGAKVLSSGRRDDGSGFDYLVFDALPGIIIELMQ